ncbi:MAG: FAD-dependent oxidoreductase, partial [Cyanobacteria bacterium J06560_2]
IFFDSYFEKVWGCRGEQLVPSCASQLLRKPAAQAMTYPALGGSQLWEACRDRLVQNGASVCLSTQAVRLEHTDNRITQVIALKDGTLQTFPVDHLISSLPLLELVTQLNAPSDVQQAARCLKYRHIAQVALILNKANLFVEQDIYVQCPEVFVSRIQNFKNWGEARMGDSDKTCLGLTYFCDASDALWHMGEDELVCLASQELVELGLVETLEQVEAGTVMRQHQAVPVETPETFRHRAIVLEYCDRFKNLQTIGRDGLHCHTRLETDILSGQSTAENIVSGRSASALCRLTGDRTGRSFHAQSTVHRAL